MKPAPSLAGHLKVEQSDKPSPVQRWGKGTRNDGNSSQVRGKERLLAAALNCYERKGLENTTLDDVALEAKISRRTIYRYFASRQALNQAVVEQQAYAFFIEMKTVVTKGEPCFADLLERCILYSIKQGPLFKDHSLLLDGNNAVTSAQHYFTSHNVATHWRSILEGPFQRGQENNELSKAIKLDALIDWVGRIILSYIQFPDSELAIKEQLKTLLLANLSARP